MLVRLNPISPVIDRIEHASVCFFFLHRLIETLIVVLGVDIGQVLTERIVADVYCTGDTIVEFITSSPLYMQKNGRRTCCWLHNEVLHHSHLDTDCRTVWTAGN